MIASNIWDEILGRVQAKVNRHSFYTWFKPTSFIAEDRASVTVRVPNTLFKDWLTKHYSAVIGEAMSDASICGLGQPASAAIESAIGRLGVFNGGGAPA